MKDFTLSIILTAANEPLSIKKALTNCIDSAREYLRNDFELITIIPDEDTINNAISLIHEKYKRIEWINIKDPHKGKPYALNLGFKKARGEYILLTDGDVYINKNSIPRLFQHFKNKNIGAVTGRAVSLDDRNNIWGYISHLLADAAHDKRKNTLNRSKYLNNITPFFVISGYLSLIKNIDIRLPEDCLVDDAYISYTFINKGYEIRYESSALVHVKYPNNLKDWLNQKARSVGGYMQLHRYGVVNKNNLRNFHKELEYVLFPIKYARSFKELIYSLILYILRLYLWIRIFIDRRILKKDFYSTWVRIESTK